MPADPDGEPSDPEPEDASDLSPFERRVERALTCTICGYVTVNEVAHLQAVLGAVCLNCGEWTVQLADTESVLHSAWAIAEHLSGTVLTERQALVYILRELLEMDRQSVADVIDTSPSNVDNLQRRSTEKVAEARRIVEGLDALADTAHATDSGFVSTG